MDLKLLAQKKCNHLKFCVLLGLIWSGGFSTAAFSAQSQYVKFNGEPTDSWGEVFELSGVENYYYVQKGDSLYDISKILFGDAKFWPKIWSLNSSITNPHKIKKSQVIYFSGGTVVAPPRFGIDSLKPQSYTYGEGLLRPEIPPSPLVKPPVAIPESLPNYFKIGDLFKDEKEKLASISAGKRNVSFAKRKILITSEIVSSQPLIAGKITRIQSGGYTARLGDLITVTINSNSAEVGDFFSIFKYTKGALDSHSGNIEADLVEWLGEIEILGPLEGSEYMAEVASHNDLLTVGASLSNERILSVALPERVSKIENAPSSRVTVIGGGKLNFANALGEGKVVYFKGGRLEGVTVDQVYPLVGNFGENLFSKHKKIVPKSIGFVKIVKVNSKFSTGVAFNLSHEVSVGNKLSVN